MGNLLSILDADETVRRGRIGGGEAERPANSVAEELAKLANHHTVMIASGASFDSLRATENHLGIEFPLIAHSHCTVLQDRRSGEAKRMLLAPLEAQAALERRRSELEAIRESHGGILDDNEEGAHVSFYGPAAFEPARIAKSAVVMQEPHLKLLANANDGGQAIVPEAVTKQIVVDWARENGYEIAFAAGDSPADAPILEAAMYPIVTYGEGLAPHPKLVEIVNRRGTGFIADKPHGLGLADGLQAGALAIADILRSAPAPRSVL